MMAYLALVHDKFQRHLQLFCVQAQPECLLQYTSRTDLAAIGM